MSFLLLAFLVQAEEPRPVPYFDPAGRLPSTYAEYVAECRSAPFQAGVAGVKSPSEATRDGGYDNLVLVLVNTGLHACISSELSQYADDLAADGFSTKTIDVSGGRPADLGGLLQVHRDSGLVGAVMVGDLPVAWWETSPNGGNYPLELFFTALDATFTDNDGDGIYDDVSGDRAPVVWLGRIYASRLTYDCEERVVRSYLQRNHAYRTGGLAIPHRGLVYNEVTWFPHDHGMSYLYSDITMFNDENTTTAHHYKQQLSLGYEFVHIIVHSSPWVHTFFLQNEVPGGSVFNFEIPALAPNAAFYFLNACTPGRFTEKDNLGNWYLFAQPWAQAVIASTRDMSGLDSLREIYEALGNDSCLGDAFLKWHRVSHDRFPATCILGDPTVRIDQSLPTLAGTSSRSHAPRSAPRLDWTVYAVDTTDFVNGNLDIDASNGQVRLVFDSGRNGRADTYWSWFQGNGFAPPESVAWHEYYDLFPSCVTDASGRFWAAWQSYRGYSPGNGRVQLASSFFHNDTWSSVRSVGPPAPCYDLQAALGTGSDDRVWCAFKSWRNGQADIWVSHVDSGGDWATPERLTTDSLGQISPCVAVDTANHPWVFWTSLTDGRWQVHARYHDGDGWLPRVAIDTSGNCYCPRAATMPDGTVWLAWHHWNGLGTDVCYSVWDGSEWSEPALVTDNSSDDILPDICCDGTGRPWVCWQSDRSGDLDVWVSYYQDGWSPPRPITADPANDYDPVIDADGDDVWVVWASDRRGFWNIYAACTDVNGIEGTRGSAVARPNRRSAPSLLARGAPLADAAGLAPREHCLLLDATGRRVAAGPASRLSAPSTAGTYFLRTDDSAGAVVLRFQVID
jgi:hypothetical protein